MDRIAAELNDRPPQIHGFQTPSHVLAEALCSRRSQTVSTVKKVAGHDPGGLLA
jgi:hypothetical protein